VTSVTGAITFDDVNAAVLTVKSSGGSITFDPGDNITVSNTVAVMTTGDGTISLSDIANGVDTVTVSSEAGTIDFDQIAGSSTVSITTTSGAVDLAESVVATSLTVSSTTGNVDVNDSITANKVTLSNLSGGLDVDADATIDVSGGAGNLDLTNTELTIEDGVTLTVATAAGSNGILDSVSGGANTALDINGAGNVVLNRNVVVNSFLADGITGTLIVSGTDVTIDVDNVLAFTGVGVSIQGATAGANSLTLDANTADITLPNVGSVTRLDDLTITTTGLTRLAGVTIAANSFTTTTTGDLQLDTNVTIDTSVANGDVTLATDSDIAAQAPSVQSLTIKAGTGDVTLQVVGTTALDALTITGGTISTGTITTGAVANESGGNVTVAGSGTVTVGTIDTTSGADATVAESGGSVWITGSDVNVAAITTDGDSNVTGGAGAAGAIMLTATDNSPTITLAGDLTAVGQDGTGGANGGDVTLAGNVLLGGGAMAIATTGNTAGNVTITGTIDDAGAASSLSIAAGGSTGGAVDLRGVIGRTTELSSLTVSAADTIRMVGAKTTGAQDYTATTGTTISGTYQTTNSDVDFTTADVTLGGDVLINTDSGAGAITFNVGVAINGTSSGGESLTLDAGTGDVTLQAIGTTTPLGTLRVADAGTIFANGNIVTAGHSTIDLGGGTLQLNSDVTLDTSGGGTNPEGADVILAAVKADAAVNNRDLTITAGTAGSARLTGAIGGTRLDGLSITAGAGIELNADITAGENSDAVTFNDDVVLQSSITIDTNGTADGAVNFNSKLDGSFDLSIDVGSAAVAFNEAIGSDTRLGDGVGAALTLTQATGGVTFNGTVNLASGLSSADDATSVTFNENVTILAGDTATTINADSLRLNGLVLSSAGDLTLTDDETDVLTLDGAQVTIDTSAAGTNVNVNGLVQSSSDDETALKIAAGTGDVTFLATIGNTTAKIGRAHV
jgi:hypothetical protein